MGQRGRMAWFLAQREDERRGRRRNKVCILFGEAERAAISFMVGELSTRTGSPVKAQGLIRYALSAAAEGLELPETRDLPSAQVMVQETIEGD